MQPTDVERYRGLLAQEKARLEEELASVGRRNPQNPNDWEAVQTGVDAPSADPNEVADHIEDYEGNSAILKELEIRYNEVRRALERIETGSYGVCEIGREPIESDRLDANPAARTCVAHLNAEVS